MALTTDTITLATVVLQPQQTYTVLVNVYRFANSPTIKLQTGSFFSAIHDTTGWAELRLEFTSASVNTIKLAPFSDGVDEIYVDGLLLVDGVYAGDYFDGDTPAADGFFYTWDGTPQASTSKRQLTEDPTTNITISGMTARYYTVNPNTAGPWRSGLGHSGTTFVGKPTRIVTGGMDDGQISFGATLKETGDGQ